MIEIRRRSFGHYESSRPRQAPRFIEEYAIYVVIKDGKRVDSFSRRKNAERKAAQLGREELDGIVLHTNSRMESKCPS